MLNSINEKEMLKNKLNSLNEELMYLKTEFSIFEVLQKNFNSYSYGKFKNLFGVIEHMFDEVIILRMSKIIVNNKDSLNLFNLINFVNSNINKLVQKNKIQNIKEQNIKFLESLKEYKKFIGAIKEYRDKSGAHIDKRLANKNKVQILRLNKIKFEKIINVIEKNLSYYWSKILNRRYLIWKEGESARQMKEVIKIINR